MKLVDLQVILGETMADLHATKDTTEFKKISERADAETKVAKSMIDNAAMIFKANAGMESNIKRLQDKIIG